MKQETLRHKEAFEYYYLCGNERGIRGVAQKYNVSSAAVAKWSKAFDWQERIKIRDIENAKKLEKKTDETIVAVKARYRQYVRDNLAIIRVLIGDVVEKVKSKEINVKNLEELNMLLNTIEKQIKLDMLLVGEATDKTELEMPKTFAELINMISKNNKYKPFS